MTDRRRSSGRFAALLCLVLVTPSSRAQDSTVAFSAKTRQLLSRVEQTASARDSLSRLADRATGGERDFLEEQVWQKHQQLHLALLAAATELKDRKRRGEDVSAEVGSLERGVRSGWELYRRQFERRHTLIQSLFEQRDATTGPERLALETRLTAYAERSVTMFRGLVGALLALEELSVDMSEQRAYAIQTLHHAAEQTRTRLTLLGREAESIRDRIQRVPADAALRGDLDAMEVGLKRTSSVLEAEIEMLTQLKQDVTALQVALIVQTGKVTMAAFQPRVLGGLLRHAELQVRETLSTKAPRWISQTLVLLAVFVGFWALSGVTQRLVRRLVRRWNVSQLVKDTVVAWSRRLTMFVGLVVILRQLGVELGPMLAGLGVAGVVVGFALQDSLSNFAAGGMILAYQPFDVGDIVDAAGVTGTVKRMSLVSTTILTFDNQTLIVPNKKIWGDVICNRTAQTTRRVDLMFGVSYYDPVEKVEHLLAEIVAADQRVLKMPPPLVKLDKLADSSLNFIVRVWVNQEAYWDVYWDLTRAVKLRFDQEGVRFPYPQRDVRLDVASANAARAVLEAKPSTPAPKGGA